MNQGAVCWQRDQPGQNDSPSDPLSAGLLQNGAKTEQVIWTTVGHVGLELIKVVLKLEARFLCKNTKSNHPENGTALEQNSYSMM